MDDKFQHDFFGVQKLQIHHIGSALMVLIIGSDRNNLTYRLAIRWYYIVDRQCKILKAGLTLSGSNPVPGSYCCSGALVCSSTSGAGTGAMVPGTGTRGRSRGGAAIRVKGTVSAVGGIRLWGDLDQVEDVFRGWG